jgi:integrase
VPFIIDVTRDKERRHVQPKGRPLKLDELAALLDAPMPEHLFLFCLLALSTLSRPAALLELTPEQYDQEDGIVDLNPPGREQTKKHRPMVRNRTGLREERLHSHPSHSQKLVGAAGIEPATPTMST